MVERHMVPPLLCLLFGLPADIEREDLAGGTVVYHTNTAGLRKRYASDSS